MLSWENAKLQLKKYWRNEDLKFVAVYSWVPATSADKKPYGVFHLKANDRQLIFPALDGYEFNRTAAVRIYQTTGLIDGKVYEVTVDLQEDQYREKYNHPFQLKIVEIKRLTQSLSLISAKNFIGDWFGRKGENPGDAASIAGQLRLNQLELYTQTKRFIFELIQNADDMPMPGKEVSIEIRLLDNFFVFCHNGQYFSRGDVMAICDAAKSTKRADETKTGYKGIGFKSVFSDSETVYIFSQDYSFKFDKSAPVYSDFKALYRPYWSKFSIAEQNKFFSENKGREKEHTNIDNIPWQIKPIWTELTELPEEIRTHFSRRNNVNIALEVGASKIREKHYDEMIAGLVDDPRFLLFLRNARKINYWPPSGPMKVIEVVKADDLTEVRADGLLKSIYKTFDAEIEINNDAFSKAGFQFEHVKLEEEKYAFKDANGNILNNIPEKLGRLKSTILSFAVKSIDEKIEKIPASESILYNYLPTSDQRYSFPFIINADFISKTDREGILSENIWNHYLFFNIGFQLTLWLRSLSENTRYWSSYLNVLPDDLLDEKHEDLSTINSAFNKGLLSGIAENSFIPDNKGTNRLTTSLLIDDTGLSAILGEQSFKDFTGSEKSLVNQNTDKKKLKLKYLNIEVFGYKELRENLKNPVNQGKLNECLKALDGKRVIGFLSWLDKACEKDLTFTDIASISFIKMRKENEVVVNLLELQADSGSLFKSSLTEKLSAQLAKAGAGLTYFSIDHYPLLKALLVKDNNTYLATDKLTYSRVTMLIGQHLTKLNVEDRYHILEVLRSLEGIEIGTIAKLPWYRNNLGEFKMLAELIDNNDFVYSSDYNSYFIHQDDKKTFGKDYTELLKGFGELLKADSFFIDLSSADTYTAYSIVVNLLSRLIKNGETDSNIYGLLAKRIRLDGKTIDGDLFLDTITTTITSEKNITSAVIFKLKDLLPDISEGSKNVSKLLEKLNGLDDENKAILRTKVFVLKPVDASVIETGILDQKQDLTYPQFLYLAIHYWFNKQAGTRKLKLAMLNPLTKAYENINTQEIFKLLDFMFEKKVANKDWQIEYGGLSYALIPKGAIICDDDELFFENEGLPGYLNEWLAGDEDKKKFLVEKGALDETYNHILFRKALLDKDIDKLEELSGDLDTSIIHFINTAKFMEEMQEDSDLTFDWCETEIIEFFSEFAEMNNVDFERRRFPVYKNNNEQCFNLEFLNKQLSYYQALPSWGRYGAEVSDHIFAAGDFLIPKELKLPQGYKVVTSEISEAVDKSQLTGSSERYDAQFYEDWDKYDEHVINVYSGNFIPYQIIFEGEIIAESVSNDEQVWESGKQYFVCKEISNEIPFCLKTMSATDAMSLARAKFIPNNSKPNSKKNNDELSEEEIRELERLFRRKLSSTELSSHWLIACFKAMKHYKKQGYDVSYAEHNFESSIKKKMLEKVRSGDEELCVLPRSAKQNLLRITLNAWNALEEDSTELFVLNSTGHQIFSNHKGLMDSSDNLLFTIATDDKDDKMKIVANLFEQESIYDSQYDSSVQVVLLIQLSGGSMFSSLFGSFSNVSKISDF